MTESPDRHESPYGRELTALGFQESLGTADWRVLGGGASTWFPTASHTDGAALARRALAAADSPGPDLDVDIRAGGVQLRLPLQPDGGGFTEAHTSLARAVSAAAAELHMVADPSELQDVQLALDTLDQSAVAPFWAHMLGYAPAGDEDLIDPLRLHPPIWFQEQDAPRPLRNRLHVDSVSSQRVADRAVHAAPALGAVSVADHGYYATVSDAEGNEVDILPLPDGTDLWDHPGTEDWRLVFAATACYPTRTVIEAADLAEEVAGLADRAGLPLRISLRPGLVVLDSGKDRWEMEPGYAALAADIQVAARARGLIADVSSARFIQVVIDAVDVPAVRHFWQQTLGYAADPREGVTDIVDPADLSVPFVFQDLDPDGADDRRAQRNRIHVDLFVPDDQWQARIDRAIAAGGRIVFEGNAPDAVTIADLEGNEIDIATLVGREERWAARGD